ncbi:MAG: type IV secretion system protein [Pseudomonadota bacterium]|nr:type IV secretion system protein [Pseudomonadota bacterium]
MSVLNSFISAKLFEQTRDYVLEMVHAFGFAGMGRMFHLTIAIGTICLTLWFIWQGWQLVTGRSRESFMAFFTRAFLIIMVVAAAQGFAITGASMSQRISDLQGVVAQVITGDDYQRPDKMVGEVLGYMLMLQAALQVYQSAGGSADMSNTLTFITGAGQAMPALIAGGLSLLNEVALNLSLVFGPLFILCYLSTKTRFLFVNWLKFTITTMFSMAVLTVVTVIALKAIIMMSVTLLAMNGASALAGAIGTALGDSPLGNLLGSANASPALTDIATVTGGIGMLLSTLVMGVPALATNFFSGGVAAAFSGFNAVGQNAAAGRGGPAGSPQDMMMRSAMGGGTAPALNMPPTGQAGAAYATAQQESAGRLRSTGTDSSTHGKEGEVRSFDEAQRKVGAASGASAADRSIQEVNNRAAKEGDYQGGSTGGPSTSSGVLPQQQAALDADRSLGRGGHLSVSGGVGTAGGGSHHSSTSTSTSTASGGAGAAGTGAAAGAAAYATIERQRASSAPADSSAASPSNSGTGNAPSAANSFSDASANHATQAPNQDARSQGQGNPTAPPDNLQLARQREAQLQQSGEFRPGTRPFEAARTTTDVAAGASQTVPEAMHTARHAPAAASTPAQQPPAPISTAQAAAAVQARQPVGEHTGSNTKTSPVTAPEVQVTQNSSSQTGDAPSGTRGAGIGDSQSPKAKGSRGIASPNRST